MKTIPTYKVTVKPIYDKGTQLYAGTYEVIAISWVEKQVTVKRASTFAQSVFNFNDVIEFKNIED